MPGNAAISGDSFSNKLHLVCFPRSFLKSTSELASCLEFLYCFLVRLHRWQTGNQNDSPGTRARPPPVVLFACLDGRGQGNTRLGGGLFLFYRPKILSPGQRRRCARRRRSGRNALSLFSECVESRFNKEPTPADEDSYRGFFAIFAFPCGLGVNSAWVASFLSG